MVDLAGELLAFHEGAGSWNRSQIFPFAREAKRFRCHNELMDSLDTVPLQGQNAARQ